MKNIFKYMFVFIAAGVLFVACDNDKTTYFDENSQAIDAASPYYVQFKNAKKALRTDFVDGSLVNISTTIDVGLLGEPQSTDIVISFSINAASTAATDMYSLSATSVTIPAGKTSASVDFMGYANKMVQNTTPYKVIVDMDAGGYPAPAGQQLTYTMFRPCALSSDKIIGDWVIDMVDSYGDGWNGASITVFIDGVGTDYDIAGAAGTHTITVPEGSMTLSFSFNSGAWDSEITFEIKGPNGAVIASDGPTPSVGEVILDACLL